MTKLFDSVGDAHDFEKKLIGRGVTQIMMNEAKNDPHTLDKLALGIRLEFERTKAGRKLAEGFFRGTSVEVPEGWLHIFVAQKEMTWEEARDLFQAAGYNPFIPANSYSSFVIELNKHGLQTLLKPQGLVHFKLENIPLIPGTSILVSSK